MPGATAEPAPALLEMPARVPVVYVNNAPYDYVTVLSIERNAGIVPSRALIRIGGSQYDVTGNITLNAFDFSSFKVGSRVIITDGDETLFMGCFIKRRDQGSSNCIIWEAWDDRWLLSKIPVRGCLVMDPVTQVVRYLSRYPCHVNPKGYRNCVGASIPGFDFVVPVFTSIAEAHAAYDNSDGDTNISVGVVTDWTASKFIKYLCVLANIAAGSVDGANKGEWRSIAKSKRIKWLYKDCEFVAQDEMNHKMPEQSYQGKTIWAAVCQVLEEAGEYGATLEYTQDSGNALKSSIKFYTRDGSYQDSTVTIPLQRGGNVSDILTAFDFDLDEDAADVAEAMLIEGAPVRVEASWKMTWDSTNKIGLDAWLKRSWDHDDEVALAKMINGTGGKAYFFTKAPNKSKGETWNSLIPAYLIKCDGTGGAPNIAANSPEAIKQARQICPRPWRAYELSSLYAKTHTLGGKHLLYGFNEKYSNTALYPVGEFIPRPILLQQLQYYLNNTDNKWLRAHYPVRIQVSDNTTNGSDGNLHDVDFNNGLAVDADGTIWLHGMTDDIGGANNKDLVYNGTMAFTPQSLTPRQIIINAAVPLDFRTRSIMTAVSGLLDPALADELEGPLLAYIDSPEGFKEHHQVQSAPSAVSTYPSTGTSVGALPGTIKAPINTVLEDDSDAGTGRMQKMAIRKLASRKYPKRVSSWSIIGVRTEYTVGQFVSAVKTYGQATDPDYVLKAPIERILYDFVDQTTKIGGLLSMTGEHGKRGQTFGKAQRATSKGSDGGMGGAFVNMGGAGTGLFAGSAAAGGYAASDYASGNAFSNMGGAWNGRSGLEGTNFTNAGGMAGKNAASGKGGYTGSVGRVDTGNPMYAAAAAVAGLSGSKR